MGSNRNLGFNQRVPIVCSEELTWSSNLVQRCNRNRRWGDGYIPTLNHFRGAKAQIANGVWRLLQMPLVINGQSPTPLTFVGQDITAAGVAERHGAGTWTVSGTPVPSYQQAGFFRDGLGFCKFNDGGILQGPDNTTGNLSTHDFAFEVLAEMAPAGAVRRFFGKRNGAEGYLCQMSAASGPQVYLEDSGGPLFVTGSAQTPGTLVHLFGLFDRSGSGRLWANGATIQTAAISSVSGSLDDSAPLQLGSGNSSGDYDGGIYLWQLWDFGDGGLDTHDHDAIAKQRAAALFGWLPLHAKGSDVPNTMSRNCAAYGYRYVSGAKTPFYLGANAMPWEEHGVDEGLTDAVHGPRADPQSVNMVLQSSTLATTWIVRGTCTATNNTGETDDPRGKGLYGASLVENVGDISVDDIRQAVIGYSASVDLASGFWIKRKSTSGTLHIINGSSGGSGGHWTINLASLPDRWVRVTRNSPYIGVTNEFVSNGSGNAGFLFYSNGDVDFYIWNVQQEENGGYEVTSDIGPTTTGSVTRLADDFQLGDGDNVGGATHHRGTVVVRFMFNNGDTYHRLLNLSDGGSAAERLTFYVINSGSAYLYKTSNGEVKQANTAVGAAPAGAMHDYRGMWSPTRVALKVDQVALDEDNTVTDIPDPDTHDVMQQWAQLQQLQGICPVLRVLAQPSLKG